MATIGERIDSINQKYNREIDTLQRDRDREIATVLAELGIGVSSVNQPKRPGPKPGRRRMKKRISQKAAPQSTATGRGGSRKRLTKNKKAALVDRALDLFNAKPGQKFSRGEIAGKLKVKPTQVQTILKEIKGLKSEGKKASTVYFVG